jgi:hypothetical protein
MMVQNIFRFSLYADQILVINPFLNPNVLAQDMNPILRPGEWRLQTLRWIYQLAQLAPWIDAGLVTLIPDPGDFDRPLRLKTWDLAAKRLDGSKPSDEDDEDIDQSAIKARTRRAFLCSPRDYLDRITREKNPGISDEDVQKVLDEVEPSRPDLASRQGFPSIGTSRSCRERNPLPGKCKGPSPDSRRGWSPYFAQAFGRSCHSARADQPLGLAQSTVTC